MSDILGLLFNQGAPTVYGLIVVALGVLFFGFTVKGAIDNWLTKRNDAAQAKLVKDIIKRSAQAETNEQLRKRTDLEREQEIRNRENPDYIDSDLIR